MTDKHTWTNEQTEFLLNTCIEELQNVGRKGLSLHKHSWNKLGITIKEKFGVDLSKRQLKNAYDNLKAKYTGWLYLKNKTGNLYNPQTNTFNLTNEEWEDFKKPPPSAASPSGNPNKRAKPSTPRPRAASASPEPPSSVSPKASITADDLALEMQKALRHLTRGPTIPQCLEKLELLKLGPVDPLRFAAYHIFGGTMNMRELWINLPNDPQILRGWIEMTATSLGVLKDGNIL
ncbi:unnamed protein product [Lactuca saligna]|uniref:Myb/SANT-like domain-containing protein n=1 Tax=Lactuca saligna TaxID=75948 RepID=A0AA35ZMS1_LACSI|nr:unnamed protein product [Lactuca saligna]